MRAGKYRHRVTFEKPSDTTTRDPETGAVSRPWITATLSDGTPLASVPAEALTGPGDETRAAGAVHAETELRVNLRWFAGLDTKWRLIWEGQPYNILSAELDATARREWRLRCKGGMSDGR